MKTLFRGGSNKLSEQPQSSVQKVTPGMQTGVELHRPSYGSISLTARQRAVLTRVYEGWKYRQIAHDLKCSEGSVKAVIQELFRKLGVRKRTLIVRIAYEQALVERQEERALMPLSSQSMD